MLHLLRLWVESEHLGEGDHVFATVAEKTLRPAWVPARRAAGPQHAWFHDLRPTYSLHRANAGTPLGEPQQSLRHASITMTMRYAVYQRPMASTHYSQALSDMGLVLSPPSLT